MSEGSSEERDGALYSFCFEPVLNLAYQLFHTSTVRGAPRWTSVLAEELVLTWIARRREGPHASHYKLRISP